MQCIQRSDSAVGCLACAAGEALPAFSSRSLLAAHPHRSGPMPLAQPLSAFEEMAPAGAPMMSVEAPETAPGARGPGLHKHACVTCVAECNTAEATCKVKNR